ncbi:MAG: efflux RND transporter periplasmic adaptor subunit [Geminicoccaceae bacterium]|nr:MAG: efflux RND transporter periplasmic adaptor subunit [Geminicoccaceae bacterium]
MAARSTPQRSATCTSSATTSWRRWRRPTLPGRAGRTAASPWPESEMRASIGVAALIALGLTGWMASGQEAVRAWFQSSEAAPVEAAAPAAAERLARVRVMTSTAAPVSRELVLHGRTEPNRAVTLRAETHGRVVELLAAKGERVEAGQPILRLDAREREAMVAQASALLRQRQLEYEAARRLGDRGFQAENQVAAAIAQLEAARAELRFREVSLGHTLVEAPFAGLLNDRHVEIGDFVDTGDALALLLEHDPILVTAEVSETRKRHVQVGMVAEVELADGTIGEGELRFLSRQADPSTRTFRVEVQAANPTGAIPAGMSARLRLRFDEVPAHELSAALLALDAQHRLGIKVVDEADVVRFVPIDLVRAERDAVFVAGLPLEVRVIVVGQGFVRDGERVVAVDVEPGSLTANLMGLGR